MKNKTMLIEMTLPDAEGNIVTCRREVPVSLDGYWPILPAICITWRPVGGQS
jgi:hypothetical protein